MKINELKPFAKKVEVVVKAVGKNEVREVQSKLDNSTHKVTEATVGDDTGTILLTLWDEAIDKVEIGKTYKIANAFTSLFKNTLRLNLGRYGELSESEDEIQVDESNNVSEKEIEYRGPRFGNRDRGGGGRGGYGGGGRGYGGGRGHGGGYGSGRRRDEGMDDMG